MMKNINILFIVNPNSYVIYYKLSEALKRKGLLSKAYFVSIYPREIWRNTSLDEYNNEIIFPGDLVVENESNYLFHLDDKFDDFSLGRIYAAEKRPYLLLRNGRADIEDMIGFQKAVFDKFKPDLVIYSSPACAAGLILHYIMLDYGIRFLYLDGERIPGRFFIMELKNGCDPKILNIYNNANNWDIPLECWDVADSVARRLINKRERISGQSRHIQNKRIKLKERFRIWFKKDYRSLRFSNMLDLSKDHNKVFVRPDYKSKYIYFPLQMEPEGTVYAWAPLCRNQYDLIYKLSLAIKPDYFLYVKESFSNFGNHNSEFYSRLLSNLPNVRFIDPSISSLDIIKYSQCTVTITGSAVLEAHLMGKRALMLSSSTYLHHFNNVHILSNQITDIASLKRFISGVLDKEEVILPWEDRIKAILAIYYGSFSGYIDDQLFNKNVLRNENIENIALAVYNYLNFDTARLDDKYYYDGDHIYC